MTAVVKEGWISGATSTVVSDPEEVPGSTTYGLQVSVTGDPSTATVRLQGSLDGVDWFNLINYTIGLGSQHLLWIVDEPVKYIRLNLDALSGGTSPTVTASAIAV